MGIVQYESRALILRYGSGLNARLEIWQSAFSSQFNAETSMPLLEITPSWVQEEEEAKLSGNILVLKRLNLPPNVFFSKAHTLRVCSVYATVQSGIKQPTGLWIPVEEVKEKVDEQWRYVIEGLCHQVACALKAGYHPISRYAGLESSKGAQPQAEPTARQESSQHSSRSKIADVSDQLQESGIGPACSGYDEASHAWGLEEEDARVESQAVGTVASDEEPGNLGMDDDEADAEATVSARPTVTWQSGLPAEIQDGGRDVQACLDAEGVKLGIINWHAPWIDACLEMQPFMQRLATRFKSVAIMNLDVEISMANKLLAYEKVLTRSESRRRGAKPIVRDNKSFPCLTVHEPSNLIPMQTFCGKDALDQLAVSALAARSKELSEAPSVQSKGVLELPAKAQASNVVERNSEDSPQQPESQAAASRPGSASESSSSSQSASKGASIQKQQVLPNLKALKRGAMELRQQLYQAKQEEQTVVVLWISGSAGGQEAFHQQAASRPGDTFLVVDVTVGKDNRMLATSLKVKGFPTVQVYINLKLVKHIDSKTATADLQRIVNNALDSLGGQKIAKTNQSPAAIEPHQSTGTADQNTETQQPVQNGLQKSSAQADYQPPKATTKAEQKRKFPSGTGIYWPKMPCLQCGCPWWLGEDWDARCARCQWSAEEDGYDDESRPLPRYKPKYKLFTDLIKSGQTAEWQQGMNR